LKILEKDLYPKLFFDMQITPAWRTDILVWSACIRQNQVTSHLSPPHKPTSGRKIDRAEEKSGHMAANAVSSQQTATNRNIWQRLKKPEWTALLT
jgi:hypothetical protein